MRPILVTGGFGFLGSQIVRSLLDDGGAVAVLAKRNSNPVRLQDRLSEITCVEGDVSDAGLRVTIGKLQPRGVFHCAASNIQSGVAAQSDELLRVNMLGVENLLAALSPIDYDFFINVGSFLEYGMKDRAVRETDVPEPMDTYALSKLGGTLLAQAVARKDGKPIVTLRLMTPYGPHMQPGRLIHSLLSNALKNESVRLTRPTVTRDFLYSEDFVGLCREVAEKARLHAGEIFNAGTGVATSLQSLADKALALTDSKSAIEWGAFRTVAYDSDIWCADMTKTFGAFEWRPKVGIDEGLAKTMEWIRGA